MKSQFFSGTLVKIGVSSCEKYIGVFKAFETYVENEINTANSTLGIIRRYFTYLDEEMFTLLFNALVRPHLEYAQSVRSPFFKSMTLIENVQIKIGNEIL